MIDIKNGVITVKDIRECKGSTYRVFQCLLTNEVVNNVIRQFRVPGVRRILPTQEIPEFFENILLRGDCPYSVRRTLDKMCAKMGTMSVLYENGCEKATLYTCTIGNGTVFRTGLFFVRDDDCVSPALSIIRSYGWYDDDAISGMLLSLSEELSGNNGLVLEEELRCLLGG